MTWVKTKEEANQVRRDFKTQGRCSCYTKTFDGNYYVSNCPLKSFALCNPRVYERRRNKKK